MKKSMMVIYVLACACFFVAKFSFESKDQKPLFVDEPNRISATFLLGEDGSKGNYFEQAELHFSLHPEERSDLIIHSLRSLEEVIHYLNENGKPGIPWGTINLVLHGNPNTGLSTQITEAGHRATPKRLVQAILLGSAPSLKNDIIDSMTQLNVWGCGIGKNPIVKISLEKIFSTGRGEHPKIYCSPHFVTFKKQAGSIIPERINLSYWPYYFKRGYKPSTSEISAAMQNQFPEADVKWQDVLQLDESARQDQYSHSYHIPVSYTKIYESKNDRPSVSSDDEKAKWVKGQRMLMDQVSDSGIPFEKFQWTVNKIIYTDEAGAKVPAIKAIGMSTVLCFLMES